MASSPKRLTVGTFFKNVVQEWRSVINQPTFFKHVLSGVLLLVLSLVINFFASTYASNQTGLTAHDIILDNIPILKLDDIYLEGFNILIGLIVFLGLRQPKKLPFMLKTIALFTVIRSFFFVLTHLALPLSLTVYNQSYEPVGTLGQILSPGNDLFFSGHTGLPFLMSLLFIDSRLLRIAFIGISILFGITVLLAHIHYSIDVFGAYFITYSIFHLSIWLFARDFSLFSEKEPKQTGSLKR